MEFLIFIVGFWLFIIYSKSSQTQKQKYKENLNKLYQLAKTEGESRMQEYKKRQKYQSAASSYQSNFDTHTHNYDDDDYGVTTYTNLKRKNFHTTALDSDERTVVRPKSWFRPHDMDE